jgi:hypothetical protein
MPRVRFTIRGMMVLVAITAFLLGGDVIRRRRDQYQRLAQAHATSARSANLVRKVSGLTASRFEEAAQKASGRSSYDLGDQAIRARSMAGYWSRMEIYHQQLRRKYDEAVSRPWRPVSADPPPPSDPLPP